MVGKLGKGRFYSKKQQSKVMSLLRSVGGIFDKDGFESDEQRKGLFGKLSQAKKNDPRHVRAKKQDRSLHADTTLPYSKKNLKRWRRRREHIDLEGVDSDGRQAR